MSFLLYYRVEYTGHVARNNFDSDRSRGVRDSEGRVRPFSPGRQRSLRGSFEEGTSEGLFLLGEAAGAIAP